MIELIRSVHCSRSRSAIGLLVVISVAPLVHAQTSVAPAPPASRPATQPAAANWFAMSPDEFARTDAAQRLLPWNDVDDRLLSAAVLHETNRARGEHDLPPLRDMPRVDDAAVMHASDMAEGGWFSHENPDDPKKKTVLDRVKLLGLRPMFVGENIIMEYGIRYQAGRKVYEVTAPDGEAALSYDPDGAPIPRHTYHSFAQQIVKRWMNSPPHRENILSPHARFLGSACRPGNKSDEVEFQKYYCAQVFFAPMPR